MQSMTGFGRGSAEMGRWHASVEISTVNRKQAEIVVQAPRELAELESRIRSRALEAISRGRAQLSISLESAGGSEPDVMIDTGMAKALQRALTALGTELAIDLSPAAGDLLRQPGLVTMGATEVDPEQAWQAIGPALDQAIGALVTMRTREGDHLKEDFLARLGTLEAHASTIAGDASGRVQRHRDLLMKRLSDSGLELDLDDERVLREIALFADRCDISEELTRLQSHFEKFREYLDGSDPCGRPLDFLCQELFREFNTIGSKANDAGVAQSVVEAKTELEKIREQVQNVE